MVEAARRAETRFLYLPWHPKCGGGGGGGGGGEDVCQSKVLVNDQKYWSLNSLLNWVMKLNGIVYKKEKQMEEFSAIKKTLACIDSAGNYIWQNSHFYGIQNVWCFFFALHELLAWKENALKSILMVRTDSLK